MTYLNTFKQLSRLALCVALVGGMVSVMVGCTASPNTIYSPVNADELEDADQAVSSRVLLNGHDVVSYYTLGRHARGVPLHTSQYQHVTLRFASAENKALFDKAPEQYLPQFGGFCANGIAYGIPWGGSADIWQLVDGKLLIFGNQAAKDAFMLHAARNLARAQTYWATEVQGSNIWWQRGKRLVFKSAHFQSDAQLAAEVAAAKTNK